MAVIVNKSRHYENLRNWTELNYSHYFAFPAKGDVEVLFAAGVSGTGGIAGMFMLFRYNNELYVNSAPRYGVLPDGGLDKWAFPANKSRFPKVTLDVLWAYLEDAKKGNGKRAGGMFNTLYWWEDQYVEVLKELEAQKEKVEEAAIA